MAVSRRLILVVALSAFVPALLISAAYLPFGTARDHSQN
jgi:hypothetical protein